MIALKKQSGRGGCGWHDDGGNKLSRPEYMTNTESDQRYVLRSLVKRGWVPGDQAKEQAKQLRRDLLRNPPPIPGSVSDQQRNERNWRVYQARLDGKTYQAIAQEFGVSVERVRQIVTDRAYASLRDSVAVSDDDDLESLGLGTRLLNALNRAGIFTLSQLVAYPPASLEKIRGLGTESFSELIEFLAKHGVQLVPDIAAHWSTRDTDSQDPA